MLSIHDLNLARRFATHALLFRCDGHVDTGPVDAVMTEAALSEDQFLIVETAARLAEQLACPAPTELPLTDDDLVGWEMLTETGFASMHVGGSHGGGDAHSADVALVAGQLAITLSCVP